MNKIRNIFTSFLLYLIYFQGIAQPQPSWMFALVSDIHVGKETGVADLERTIQDINLNKDLEFVIISGDITDFGSDEELKEAKRILDRLNKPWHVVPGNHDTKWSESGGNSFKRIFGSETFAFEHKGYFFVGNNSGPNMRMGPAQIPRENLVWMDSLFRNRKKELPVIFINHYPQNASVNNWYENIDRLKKHDVRLLLCGHEHVNKQFMVEGIPAIMSRTNLRWKDSIGGYNIVTINRDSVWVAERVPLVKTKSVWAKASLYKHDFDTDTTHYPRPSYAVNKQYQEVRTRWQVQEKSDIGSGTAINGNIVITTNTSGWITALDVRNGKLLWKTPTGGKIYSTPAVSDKYILVASTDKFLYCLEKNTGKVIWKQGAGKPIVSSPVIKGNKVFSGGSDGHFRAYDLPTGRLLWDYDQVKGFIETKPLLYNGSVYFGSWGNEFYALDESTGKTKWVWNDGYTSRMFSPAACYPVAVANRLFIVAPDNIMTCFNSNNGNIVWRKKHPEFRVRESMGLSADSSLVYVKTMEGEILGISTSADSMKVNWKADRSVGNDRAPTAIVEKDQRVFISTNSGQVYAFSRKDGKLVWIHKISDSLVNQVNFVNTHELITTTMDGEITCLQFH